MCCSEQMKNKTTQAEARATKFLYAFVKFLRGLLVPSRMRAGISESSCSAAFAEAMTASRLPRASRWTAQRTVTAQRAGTQPQARAQRRRHIVER